VLRNPLLVPDLRELIHAGETAALRDFFGDQHPAHVAEIIEDLGESEGDTALTILPDRLRASVMSYVDPERQVRVVELMSPVEAAALLHLMSHDDRADLVNRLDEDRVDQILRNLAHAEREDIRRLASYEEGTAGAVMTTDYATLTPGQTVHEAIARLRHEAPDRETIDYSFVVDPEHRLLGIVPLKRLIMASPRSRIDVIMQRDIIVGRVDEDQESVARKIDKYDLYAIPVLDASDMLVGIVTHDDAMDILRREQTEDILKFGGVSADREADNAPYWQSGIVGVFRRRLPWLLMLLLAENFTYPVLRHFEWVRDRFESLGWFIALLIGTGGNAGSQTVGTIIRGLSLNEIGKGDLWRVLVREASTGLLLGLTLGLIGFGYAHYWRSQPWPIAQVIGLTILCVCVWANTIGALVPLLAKKAGIDPAVISAPFITTLVDATGLVIYFSIAIALLVDR
jgi:magnesium transporter